MYNLNIYKCVCMHICLYYLLYSIHTYAWMCMYKIQKTRQAMSMTAISKVQCCNLC